MSSFKNSIAQNNVNFPIETVIQPLAGENYSRVMIFIPLSKAATYLPGSNDVAAGTLTVLNSSNYGSLTGDVLKTSLVPFFTSAGTGIVGIAIYDDSTPGEGEEIEWTLAAVYEQFKMYAYFKLAITDQTGYIALQVELSNLCVADPLYSAMLVGTSDTLVLEGTSSLMTALNTANSNARVIYNPDVTINPALAQLGITLATANSTGTPVGNSVDMVAFNTINASGALNDDNERENLTPTQKLALDSQKIGYQTWVGDGTENVVTEGSLTLQGESFGANWVKNYITYVCKVKTANLIAQMNRFRNNDTYQSILLILTDIVNGFITMGRLADFEITAPAFRELPTSGDTITVANAWHATYIDNVREVTVYGILYITQPTR